MCGLVVLDGLRELGLDIRVDSLEDILVVGYGRVCIPYLRENGNGVGEGGDGGRMRGHIIFLVLKLLILYK